MSDKKSVLKSLKDDDIAYVDLRFCDPKGKLQHVTVISELVDEDFLDEGFMFDGSSIAGWKSIEKSDMKLMADPASAYVDPFFAEKTLCLHCSVLEPDTNEPYERDPRGTAREGRGLPEADRHRRHLLLRPRGGVLHSRRRALLEQAEQGQLRDRRGRRRLEHRHRLRDGQHGPPPRRQGRLLPAAAGRRRPGHPRRDALDDEADGDEGRQAPPRGGVAAARAGPDLRLAHPAGRQHPEVQVRHPAGRRRLRQDARPSCRSPTTATTARACTSTCRSSRAASRSSPATSTPTSRRGAVVHRRDPEARQDDQRLHQPDDQQLQAADPGLRGAGAARLLGAQPLGLDPHPVVGEPEGQARRGPLPRPVRQPLPRLRGAADGRHRRHPQQDRPGRGGGQGPLRPAAGGAGRDPDGLRLACARR